jgi:hypothetical protein
MSAQEQLALFVNHTLHRLPLIYEMLEEIHETADAHPGDEDLKHGAFRAVTTMVERIRGIEPPATSDSRTPPTKEEEIAGEWLIGDQAEQLLPPDLYQELATLTLRLFPRTARIGFKGA